MELGLKNHLRSKLVDRFGISKRDQLLRLYDEQFMYGQREVLLKYISAPTSQIFLAKIPHSGHTLNRNFGGIQPEWDYKGKALFQAVWNTGVQLDAKARGIQKVHAVGAPFIYHLLNEGYQLDQIEFNFRESVREWSWPHNAKDQLSTLEGRSILFMPLHSWEGEVFEPKMIESDFFEHLFKFQDFGISLGYLDYLNPITRSSYERYTRNIHCAGLARSEISNTRGGGRHIFYKSLQRIIQSYDVVIGEEFTTGLLYASALGKKVGILDRNLSIHSNSRYYKQKQIELGIRERLDILREDYGWLSGDQKTESQRISNLIFEFGLSSIKSSNELDALIPRLEFYPEE